MLRVLHVLEAIEAGVARHVTDIVRHVPAEHLVAVPPERVGGFTDAAGLEAMDAAGAEIHFTAMRRSPVDLRNAVAVGRVRRLIRYSRPHIVHGHASIGGVAARLAATGTGAARVYTPNGVLRSRATVAVERALGHLTDAFVAVSETEAQLVSRLRLARPGRVTVIPNGIEVDQAAPASLDLRAELGVDASTPIVGSVARLSRQKAPDVFVRACALAHRELPEARFVLIGDGPLAPVITREVKVADFGDRFLHLRGLLGATTVMDQFDVFALASRYEGGPYAPLEAMRAGTPVVLTNVIGNRDTVEDGRSGILVPPDSPGALAAAMLRVLSDGDLRKALAKAGQARVAAHFDVRMMADRLTSLYQALAKEPRCPTP